MLRERLGLHPQHVVRPRPARAAAASDASADTPPRRPPGRGPPARREPRRVRASGPPRGRRPRRCRVAVTHGGRTPSPGSYPCGDTGINGDVVTMSRTRQLMAALRDALGSAEPLRAARPLPRDPGAARARLHAAAREAAVRRRGRQAHHRAGRHRPRRHALRDRRRAAVPGRARGRARRGRRRCCPTTGPQQNGFVPRVTPRVDRSTASSCSGPISDAGSTTPRSRRCARTCTRGARRPDDRRRRAVGGRVHADRARRSTTRSRARARRAA